MATPLFLLLLLAMSLQGSDGAWCVCRSNLADAALQKTLDYACGHGADCAPLLPSGQCYNPNTVSAHCSYAANSYFQRNSQVKGATCDFGGTATLSTTDPSSGTCKYPATASAAGTTTGTGTGTAGTGAGTSTSSPGSKTPTTPSMGGSFTTPIGASGPAANTMSPDSSEAAAAAAAFVGRHVLLGIASSILAFLVL